MSVDLENPYISIFLLGGRRGEQIKRETITKDYKDNKMLNNTYSYNQIDHRLEYSRNDREHTPLRPKGTQSWNTPE